MDYQDLAKKFIKEHNEISEHAEISWNESAAILLFATWLDMCGAPWLKRRTPQGEEAEEHETNSASESSL